jgi:3-phosphoshikimate 1-carboxyvinyltransferase
MNTLKISTNKLPDKIEVPSSKSYANRALILAALSSDCCEIENITWSQDVMDMVNVLKRIGLDIRLGSSTVTVLNSFPACEVAQEEVVEISLGEGGTTARFLVVLLALGQNNYLLHAEKRMKIRPMDELYESLSELGVVAKKMGKDSFPVQIKGPVEKGRSVIIDCSQTTQFYSAMLLVSRFSDLSVSCDNLSTSKGYVEITQKLIEEFSSHYTVQVDFSGASYSIAFAALNSELIITNCEKRDDLQGDAALIEIINKAGGHVQFDREGLHIKPTASLHAMDVNCEDCPDLVPTLVFLAAYAKGKSFLHNVKVLKHKESDRILALQDLLDVYQVPNEYDEKKDCWMIEGVSRDLSPRDLKVAHDHRIVMAATLFLKHNGGGSISPADAVEKSYPGFFDIF